MSNCCDINPPKKEVDKFDNDIEVSFLPMKDIGINKKLAIPYQKKKLKEERKGNTYFDEEDVFRPRLKGFIDNMLMLMKSTDDDELQSDDIEFSVLQTGIEAAGAEIMPYVDAIGTYLIERCVSDLKEGGDLFFSK